MRKSQPRRGRKPAPLNETAADRFDRLAQNRLKKALYFIELLGNLSRRSQYEYTESDAEQIIATLTDAVSELEASFERGRPAKDIPEPFFPDARRRRGRDSGAFRDTRTARQRYLDRHKEGRRFSHRRLGVGPRH